MLSDKQLEEIRFDIKNTKPTSSLQGLFRQHCETLLAENTDLREQLAEARELLGKEIDAGIELQRQLAQVTQERDNLQGQLIEEVAKRINDGVEQMEQSQKITQAELKRHCSDDRLTDTQRGSYQD